MRLIGGVMCSGAAPKVNIVGLGCSQHPTPWQGSPATCRWNKGSPATPHSNNTPRHFDGWLGQLIRLRDQTCTDPYCDAPIRHLDHIIRHSDDGPTTLENARGTCERGNYVREMPGWHISLIDCGFHSGPHTTSPHPQDTTTSAAPRPTLSRSLIVVTSLSRDLCHTHGLS